MSIRLPFADRPQRVHSGTFSQSSAPASAPATRSHPTTAGSPSLSGKKSRAYEAGAQCMVPPRLPCESAFRVEADVRPSASAVGVQLSGDFQLFLFVRTYVDDDDDTKTKTKTKPDSVTTATKSEKSKAMARARGDFFDSPMWTSGTRYAEGDVVSSVRVSSLPRTGFHSTIYVSFGDRRFYELRDYVGDGEPVEWRVDRDHVGQQCDVAYRGCSPRYDMPGAGYEARRSASDRRRSAALQELQELEVDAVAYTRHGPYAPGTYYLSYALVSDDDTGGGGGGDDDKHGTTTSATPMSPWTRVSIDVPWSGLTLFLPDGHVGCPRGARAEIYVSRAGTRANRFYLADVVSCENLTTTQKGTRTGSTTHTTLQRIASESDFSMSANVDDDDKKNAGAAAPPSGAAALDTTSIALIAAGGVLFIVLLIVAIYYVWYRAHRDTSLREATPAMLPRPIPGRTYSVFPLPDGVRNVDSLPAGTPAAAAVGGGASVTPGAIPFPTMSAPTPAGASTSGYPTFSRPTASGASTSGYPTFSRPTASGASTRYVPASTYAPATTRYAPATTRYAPATTRYAPATTRYAPASTYAPATARYAPATVPTMRSFAESLGRGGGAAGAAARRF